VRRWRAAGAWDEDKVLLSAASLFDFAEEMAANPVTEVQYRHPLVTCAAPRYT
jgi:hypothetical protein